ncbi:hypothetical protein SMA90_33140, partial [Escherichia coli]
MPQIVQGKNLILRPQVPGDAAFFAKWYNQRDIMFQCGFTERTSEQQERAAIARRRREKDSVWFTITKTDGE